MADEVTEYRSGFFGFWFRALCSRRGLAVFIPLVGLFSPLAIDMERRFVISGFELDPVAIPLVSFFLLGLGFMLAVYWTYDVDMSRAGETIATLRKENLIRPEIDIEFQKGSEYVPRVRTKALKEQVVRERKDLQQDLEQYEQRIREATAVIEKLEGKDQLRESEYERLKRAREKREMAQAQREKWREVGWDSIEERRREVRKGRLYIDFHFRVANESENISATLLNVNLEPCDERSNRFSYLPEETSSKDADAEGRLVIEPNTSVLMRQTAEVRIPSGREFESFLDTLQSVGEKERDSLRFELSFRGHETSYSVEFDKHFRLRPLRETLLEHWKSHDFQEALQAFENRAA